MLKHFGLLQQELQAVLLTIRLCARDGRSAISPA
jgi:hypothetical protein